MSIRLEMLEAAARGARTLNDAPPEGWDGDAVCRHGGTPKSAWGCLGPSGNQGHPQADLGVPPEHGDKQRLHATLAFVLSRRCDDGGFRGRGDRSDLYYTTFAAQTLCALVLCQTSLDGSGEPRPEGSGLGCWLLDGHGKTAPYQSRLAGLPEGFRSYLAGFRDLQSLGLVNLCCLIRCWACLGIDSLDPAGRQAMRETVYSHRSGDGGFAIHPGLSGGSAYGCFLALSALQDLGDAAVAPGGAVAAGLVACVLSLRRPEGGFANEDSVPIAMAPSTAAAIMVLTQTAGAIGGDGQGWPPPITEKIVRESIVSAAEWLRSSRRADGGFGIVEGIDSDLLSTATALHALASVKTVIGNPNGADRQARQPHLENDGGQAGSDFGLPVGAVERSERKSPGHQAETSSPRDLARKYILGLRERGGFCGGAADRTCDCEYTFYGLLALGHL